MPQRFGEVLVAHWPVFAVLGALSVGMAVIAVRVPRPADSGGVSENRLDDIERRLRTLEDERDIARLIASYGPLVDAGAFGGAAALWTVDGSSDVEG